MRLLLNLASIFGYICSVVSQPIFLQFDPLPPALIEWDQTNLTYYTGQTMTLNWTSQGFAPSDLGRIQYPGAGGTRTLTSGSGTPIQAGTLSLRLSDSSNSLATNVPLTLAHATNLTNSLQSSTRITIIQSRLLNIVAFDGNRTLGGGQNTVCDNRNLTLMWRGLGEAQFGTVSIVLRRQSGFSGTQILATVSGVPVSGNVSLDILCPRGTSPSSSNSYAFQLTVNEPGGSDYTGNSPSFNVAVASTPTPSPSLTPTSSKTPSPSPSTTPSPSFSSTPTPSITPSMTMTPSTTETARPSIDYAAIGRAAAEQVDTTTPAIAGAIGGIGGVLLLLGIGKWYQTKKMTERRKKKLAQTSRFLRDAQAAYGLSYTEPQQPSVVMYSVQGLPPKKQMDSYKKAIPPKQTDTQ